MFAPDFVFSIAASLVAERYITSNLEIDTIAYKFSTLINTVYEFENAETLKNTAENFMYSMVDAGIDNSDVMLLNYRYHRFIVKNNGKKRNWSPMFGDPIQGTKKKVYTANSVNRDFKAFVYRTKQSGEYICPAGWSLGSQNSNEFLSELDKLEVSAFDILRSGN